MSKTPWSEKTKWQKIWSIICATWLVLTGIPSALAVIEMFFFGIAINSFLFKPIFTPQISCIIGKSIPEGNGFLTDVEVVLETPLYLRPLPIKFSKKYDATLQAFNGFSFFKASPSEKENSPKDFERLFDGDASIAKVLTYQHRFISKESYSIFVSVSGPSNLVEGECPFEYSVRY